MSGPTIWQCKTCHQILASTFKECPSCTECEHCGEALEACGCEAIFLDDDDDDTECNYG